MAAPMPPAPPVTSATFSASFMAALLTLIFQEQHSTPAAGTPRGAVSSFSAGHCAGPSLYIMVEPGRGGATPRLNHTETPLRLLAYAFSHDSIMCSPYSRQ